MSELIAGIDLGTTNSEISFVIDGRLVSVPVDGSPVMPSCVGLAPDGSLLVGKNARNQLVSAPESTIVSIKRKMGRDIRVTMGDRECTPEEISAMILAELKKQAEMFLEKPVEKAVITVPAFFQDHQRQATIEAGKMAGLDVVRIINEPTAAAVAYEADHAGNQRMLVYDLGGGTFDVSLVVVEDGIVEVKSSHGDTELGGDDFDRMLVEHVLEHIRMKHDTDLSGDLRIERRLLVAAEKAKCELSDHPFATLREEYLTPDINLELEISRNEYETMIRPLLMRTLESVHQCLQDASCLPGAIDRILLAGGATRTPLIHRMLEEEIGRQPRYEINPDLIVSIGAAAHGAIIGGAETRSVLVDITPHTFGTSAVDIHDDSGIPDFDIFVPVIRRNTPLPAMKSEVFSTIVDKQESVEVTIYQGENTRASDNMLIGKFLISGLSPVPAPNAILLNMELDLNGVLKVTATEKSTRLSKSVVVETGGKSGTRGSDQLLCPESVISSSAAQRSDDGNPDADQKETVLIRARRLRQRAEKLLGGGINPEDARELNDLLGKSREAISAGETELLDEYNSSFEDLLFYLEG